MTKYSFDKPFYQNSNFWCLLENGEIQMILLKKYQQKVEQLEKNSLLTPVSRKQVYHIYNKMLN